MIQIEENFGFKWILAQMDSMRFRPTWNSNIRTCSPVIWDCEKNPAAFHTLLLENNKLELRNCFSKLGNEFETGLNNYQKLLDEIQGGPTVNLNNLTVS